MKVTVIDCSVSGHRETYYKQFAQTWAGMGHETSLIAPDGKGVQETVAFQPVSALPLLPLPAGKPLQKKLVVLRNAVIRLRNLYRLRRSLQRLKPDLVFFACLDDMLPTLAPLWLFNLLLPYQWSGLLVQSALPPYHRGMPDTRPFLRSKNCVGVGILNEYSAKSLGGKVEFETSKPVKMLVGPRHKLPVAAQTEGESQRKEGDIPARFHQFPQGDKVTAREYPFIAKG